MGSADDLDSVEIPAESPAPEQPAPTPPPATPPATPQAPQAEAAKPAPQPPQQAAPPPAPGEDMSSPEGLVQQLAQHRTAVVDALAADRFKLSKEEISALDTDAVGAIPHVMARVYYEAMQSTLIQLQNLVPRMVQNVLKQQRSHDEAEQGFYGKFPALQRDKVHNDVLAMATMFRQLNPKVTRDELFGLVGAAVAAKHGINLAAAPVVNGGRPSPAPFVPAQAGAHVKITPESESPWMGLGKDYDE